MPEKDVYQISLKAFLRNEHGECLILGGQPNGTYVGYFDLPGGRIDTSEFTTPIPDILKRELFEELQVTDVAISDRPVALGRHEIPPGGLEGKPGVTHVMYLFFEAQLLSGTPVMSNEHSSMRWVDLRAVDTSTLFRSGIREGIEMYLHRPRS